MIGEKNQLRSIDNLREENRKLHEDIVTLVKNRPASYKTGSNSTQRLDSNPINRYSSLSRARDPDQYNNPDPELTFGRLGSINTFGGRRSGNDTISSRLASLQRHEVPLQSKESKNGGLRSGEESLKQMDNEIEVRDRRERVLTREVKDLVTDAMKKDRIISGLRNENLDLKERNKELEIRLVRLAELTTKLINKNETREDIRGDIQESLLKFKSAFR